MDIPGDIVSAYPDLKKSRIKPSDAVDGGVAIRAWKPRLPNARMKGDFLATRGDSVFIPSVEHGVIELDTRAMGVSRVIAYPIKNCSFIGGLATNEKSLLMNANHRLFTIPLSGGDGVWKEIQIPGTGWDGTLTWHLEGWGEEFFVGSIMLVDSKSPPRMLAGKIKDGILTWLVSSDRRPMVNPLDGLEPLDTHLAYRNAGGNTLVLLERLGGKSSMVELESGKELFPFVPMSQTHTGAVLSIQKQGLGTWILSGINTHSGTTTINSGKLTGGTGGSCANSANSAVSLAAAEKIASVEISGQRLMLHRGGDYILLEGRRFPRLKAASAIGKLTETIEMLCAF